MTDGAAGQKSVHRGCVAVALLGLFLLAVSGSAFANCQDSNDPAGSVTFRPPAVLVLPSNPQAGDVIWTSPPATPANDVTLSCSGSTGSGVHNTWGSPLSGNELFPTLYPWLSYKLVHHVDSYDYLLQYPDFRVPTGNVDFRVPSKLQLIITGTVPPGSHVVNGQQIAIWDVDLCNEIFPGFCIGDAGTKTVEHFNIATTTVTVVRSCDSRVVPSVVQLPSVAASSFSGPGSSTGNTPFHLKLTHCPANYHLTVTIDTDNPQAGTTGVIQNEPGAGQASHVGIQVLDSNQNPVSFGTAMEEGLLDSAGMNVSFYARYYQIGGTAPTAGKVSATATYTLNYY